MTETHLASPWVRSLSDRGSARRDDQHGREVARVRLSAKGWAWSTRAWDQETVSAADGHGVCPDREAAKAAADDVLRAAGLRLVSCPGKPLCE
jgi:hypothetical protein